MDFNDWVQSVILAANSIAILLNSLVIRRVQKGQ